MYKRQGLDVNDATKGIAADFKTVRLFILVVFFTSKVLDFFSDINVLPVLYH